MVFKDVRWASIETTVGEDLLSYGWILDFREWRKIGIVGTKVGS